MTTSKLDFVLYIIYIAIYSYIIIKYNYVIIIIRATIFFFEKERFSGVARVLSMHIYGRARAHTSCRCLLPSQENACFHVPAAAPSAVQCSRVPSLFALIETTHQLVHALDNHGSLTRVASHACHLNMRIYTIERSNQDTVLAAQMVERCQITFG